MAKIKTYEKAILKIIKEFVRIKYANIVGANQLVADKEQHRYQIVKMG